MLLEIFVAPDCPGCREARAVAAELRQRFPWLRLDLVELDGERPLPVSVVATPTYLLDGVVISLGNPSPERLIRELARRHEQRNNA